jgi:hypothetical protein
MQRAMRERRVTSRELVMQYDKTPVAVLDQTRTGIRRPSWLNSTANVSRNRSAWPPSTPASPKSRRNVRCQSATIVFGNPLPVQKKYGPRAIYRNDGFATPRAFAPSRVAASR